MEQKDAFKVGWAGVVENKYHEEREAGEGAESISPSCLGRLDTAPQVETALNAPQMGTKMLGLESAGGAGHQTPAGRQIAAPPRRSWCSVPLAALLTKKCSGLLQATKQR